jgi:ribosomal protein S11
MAKKKAAKPEGEKQPSTSQLVRTWLESHKTATVAEIISAFKEQGIQVSEALASKLKYTRGGKKAKRGKRRGAKPAAARQAAPDSARKSLARGEKASAIRNEWRAQGRKARPRDVIAALQAKGIAATSSEVSGVRDRMIAKRKARRASMPEKPTTGAVPTDHLIAAKILAEKLGGVDFALEALTLLSRLI